MKLFDYQKKVLEDTKHFNRVAYYLDMGLGKTFIGSVKAASYGLPIYVICQKSKIKDWQEHFKEHHPECEVTVINYDLVWRRDIPYDKYTLILDESSLIKNPSSKRTKFIMKMKCDNLVMLSGTVCGGKYEDLYTQIRLLGWKISVKDYWNSYITWFEINAGFPLKIVNGYKNVDKLIMTMRSHGAVFMKSDDVIDLPDTNDIVIDVPITKDYKVFRRDEILKHYLGDTSLKKLLYERCIASEGKVNYIKELVSETDGGLIIFYNFKFEFEYMKKLFKDICYVNGDGTDLDGYENKITLIQFQSGSMGLNLQKVNKIIYLSPPLSSDLFEQSKKRIHRVGQDRKCFYYYLIMKGSVEEKIYQVLSDRKDYTLRLFE